MADILNKLVSLHLVFRNEDIARKTACLLLVTLTTITIPFNLLMVTQHNAQRAPSLFISQTESVVIGEQPCYQYPNGSFSELGNASRLAQSIFARFGEDLAGQYAPYLSAAAYPRLISREPPFEEWFDGLIQGYQVLGFTSHNGSTIEIYYSNAPGNNGYFLAFLARPVDSDLAASAPSEYVSVTRGVAEMLGVPLENLTESSTFFKRNTTSVILSSMIAGQRLVGCDLFAVTFDNMTNRVLAVQSRPFISSKPTPLFTLEQAMEVGEEIARSEVLRSDDVFESGEVVGIRFIPLAEAVDPQPVPDDPANVTYSSRLNIRFGYEYVASIGSPVDNEADYEILAAIDIQSGQSLMVMVTPFPISTGGGYVIGTFWIGLAMFLVAGLAIGVIVAVSPEVALAVFGLLVIPVYARLAGSRILDNFNRGRIMGYISARPGATFSDIMNALDIANGNLAYHLAVLEKLEFLTSRKEGGVRRVYPQGTTPTDGQGQWLGKTEVAVLEKLAEDGPVSNIALARSLGVSRQRTHYNLKLLQKRGLVERSGKLWMTKHSDRSGSPSNA